jgi:hypothetical protein
MIPGSSTGWVQLACPSALLTAGRSLNRRSGSSKTGRTGTILAFSGVLGSIIYPFDTFDLLDPWFAKLEMFTEARLASQPVEIVVSFLQNALLGLFARCSQYAAFFSEWERRALKLLGEDLSVHLKLQLLTPIVWSRTYAGRLSEAEPLMNSCRQIVRSSGVVPLATILVRDAEAFFSWLNADFESCRRAASEQLRISSETGVHGADGRLQLNKSASALSTGDLPTAEALLSQVDRSSAPIGK